MQFIFLLFLSFSLFSCEHLKEAFQKKAESSSPAYTRYDDGRYKFSIEFPKDWSVKHRSHDKEAKDYLTLVFNAISPSEGEDDEFRERIGVVVIDLEETKNQKRKPKKQDGTKIGQSGHTRIEGELATWHISKSYIPKKKKIKLRQMSFALRKGAKIYRIGWIGEAKKLKGQEPLIWYVAHSIRLSGQPPSSWDQTP